MLLSLRILDQVTILPISQFGYCFSPFRYWRKLTFQISWFFRLLGPSTGYLGPLAVGNVMRKFIEVLGLVACLSTVGVAPSFAGTTCILGIICINTGGGGGGGGGAPAPEIGASALGMLLAGGLAAYIRARRRG
jgi:hypothetical protein